METKNTVKKKDPTISDSAQVDLPGAEEDLQGLLGLLSNGAESLPDGKRQSLELLIQEAEADIAAMRVTATQEKPKV